MAFTEEIGIDLGTANVLVYIKGKGIVLEEPSVVAVDEETDEILAVGQEAKEMLGRTPANIIALRPLRDGVISDYDVTERMLKYFIKKTCGSGRFFRPRIMICVPSGVTEVEKRAVREAAAQAGGKDVFLMEEPLAAAIGADIDKVMKQHCNAHWVRPKMIYISNLTETGLTYNKAELKALREKCDEHGLYVFMDGARLAMALTQKDNDLKFTDLPELCDVFYIGGTKCGVLFGEAIVIVNDSMKPDFNRIMKQKGAVLAKGRLLGVQFKAMFDGDLYLELGQHCNDLAQQLISAIAGNGYEFMWPPCSNMIFPIFPLSVVKKLDEAGVLYDDFEEVGDGKAAMRLCTSWSTTQEEVDEFIKLIEK